MTLLTDVDAYGVLIEPATLRIQRLLPGPIERCWAYLVDSDLRRQWLAVGEMELRQGTDFELTWRNSELSNPPGQRPEGFGAEHSMKSTILEIDQPRRLVISWGSTGGVVFELEPAGSKILLTLTHRRVADPSVLLNVSAGWHAHLDVLVERATGRVPTSFWDRWSALKEEYRRRLPQ